MKKWLLILGMITCITGLTACGNAKNDQSEVKTPVTQDQIEEYTTSVLTSVNQIVIQGQQEQYADDAIITNALDGWKSALEDMGDYNSIEKCTFVQDADGTTIDVVLDGTKRKGHTVIELDEDMQLTSITTSVKYTIAEMMEKAGLNTLLGMGTVFVVLILISLIISCFKFIAGAQNSAAKGSNKKPEKSMEHAVAQIVENEEQSANFDYELTAVIAAAIAASEGAASTDGYIVRSIRRIR